MDTYKGEMYKEINQFLRNTNNEDIFNSSNKLLVRYIQKIDSNMTNDGTLSNIVLYRGIDNDVIPNAINNSSGVLVNKSYSSCSYSLQVAKNFLDDNDVDVVYWYLQYQTI